MSKARTYLDTHKLLTFEIDSRKFPYTLWMKLGEAQSKCDHIAGVPLLPYMASDMHRLYLAKGVLATTAIEGNTLTESQVLEQLDGKLKLPPSKVYLAQEVQNIIDACNAIGKGVLDGSYAAVFDVEQIKNLNRLVLNKLSVDEDVVPGQIRKHSVVVGRYRGAPAEDCKHLLERLCEYLNNFTVPGFPPVAIGLLKATFAHLYIAWIHPFCDGNGRTSRLMEFIILLQAGVSTPAAHLLSNHYNQTRTEYYRQLDKASKNGGDITDFIQYAVTGFADGLKEQIEIIKKYQLDITWQKFIFERFKTRKMSPADRRRRDLLIELSSLDEPPEIAEVQFATPRIADAYARVSAATLHRDLQLLWKKDRLIDIKGGIVKPRKELIESFLPHRAEP